MTRKDFFLILKGLFKDLNKGLIKSYRMVLNDAGGEELDYEKLYEILNKEYQYRSAPAPAWFAQRVSQVKKEKCGESLIEQHLREGKAKILNYDEEKKEQTIETAMGVYTFALE